MKLKFSNAFWIWYIMFSLICVGSLMGYIFGLCNLILKADVTYLSFIIYILFMIFSVRIGIHNYRYDREMSYRELDKKEFVESILRKQEVSWFVADMLLTLGMLGTVIGFIYMLAVNFSNLDMSKIDAMRATLATMGVGMSTALYTTAAGLVCSLILKIQLFNFNQLLENGLKDYCDV